MTYLQIMRYTSILALAVLPVSLLVSCGNDECCSAPTQENAAHDGHDHGDDDEHDVDSERVEGAVVVTGGVALIAHIVGIIEDIKEGWLVHQHPDPAAQDSDAESLNSI